VVAPVHQHLVCARLDFDVDGTENLIEEVEAEVMAPGPDNPWANGFRAARHLLERESDAQREVNPATSRSWRVSSSTATNALGQPTAYKLVPVVSTPTLLARAESSVAKRAGFARHNFWATPYEQSERRAAGDYPNQHEGGAGLPEWTSADRPLVDRDVVCWYTFGVTHFPRPEDWPVMPVEYTGFTLMPVGFFDRNPALDVPPSASAHCHSE
jgi:primary-amine oxidase